MKRLFIDENKSLTTPNDVVSPFFIPYSSYSNVNQLVREDCALHWFPMRVTYHREMKIKASLDEIGIENFVPLRYRLVETKNGNKKKMLVPAIHNLIFVRSTQECLTQLKMTKQVFAPMRYIMKKTSDEKKEILRIPDRQMDNFMRVASVQDDRVMFLENNAFINKVGQRVKVNDGFFAGVEGVIKRINKNKRVVVQLEGVASVAIVFVPSNQIEII